MATQSKYKNVKRAARTASASLKRSAKKAAEGTYKCQICGKEHKNSLDAATHLMDHGASALESISALIKEQKEGRVSEQERGKMREAVSKEREKIES